MSFILYPVTFSFKVVSVIFAFALSFLPFDPFSTTRTPAGTSTSRRRANAQGITDPQAAAGRFLLDFESNYGTTHPEFFQGTYNQAIEFAKRELKYLIVYLHSEDHDDTEHFCRYTIASEAFTSWAREKNVVVWAGDIRETESFKVSSLLMTTRYPFVALVSFQGSRAAQVIDRYEGPKDPEELITSINQHMERIDPQMFAIRAERNRHVQARSIREQQDAAYQQSLLADQEKERKAREEREKLEKEKAEKERLEQERLQFQQLKKERKLHLLHNLAPEPDASESNITKLSVRLPNGTRIIRRFRCDDKVETLYEFVESQDLEPLPLESEFILVNTYPRKEIFDLEMTLKDAGLERSAALIVEEKL